MNTPNGWTSYSLGDVAPSASNDLPAPSTTVWNLSLEDIESTTGRVLARSRCQVNELGSSKCAFDSRHVLYSKLRPYLNKVVLPDGPGVGTSELIPMLPDSSRICREYLAHYLRSPSFIDFANANTRGANLPRIAMPELWRHHIPVPKSIDEQRRIVNRINECLSRVEEIEKLRTEGLRESDLLKSAVFADFVESIRLTGVKTVTLGDVVSECKYGTSVKASANGDGCPVLRMGNIKGGQLDISDLKHVELPDDERAKYLLSQGDILVNRTNSLELVGKSAMFDSLPGEWVYASYLVRLRVDRKKALPEYVNGIINSRIGRAYVLRTARRAIGMVNINAKEIQRMPLPLPPIDIQRNLVDRMSSTTPLVEGIACEMRNEAISELRSSILRKAFAGEL